MKKLFILMALGSVSLLSADQYYQSSYDNGQGGYNRSSYSDNNSSYGQNQRNDQNFQRNDQWNSQPQSRNQYNQNAQNNPQTNQSFDQNPSNFNNSTRNDVSDLDITKKIHDTLTPGWFSKGFQDVSFEVNNGVVTLKGSVDKADDKRTVENDVRKIDGVKQVYNNIAIRDTSRSNSNYNSNSNPNYNSRNDSNLNSNGNPNFNSRNDSNLNSNTNPNYNVTIDSSANPNLNTRSDYNSNANVNTRNDSNYTSSKSSSKYSESDLLSSEKKYPQDTAATPEDRQINAKIRSKLSGWFTKGYETVILRTSNGVVVITGTVEKSDEIQKVNDKIKDVEGVKSVNNQVTVQKK